MNDDDHEVDDIFMRFNEVDALMEDDTIEEAVVAACLLTIRIKRMMHGSSYSGKCRFFT